MSCSDAGPPDSACSDLPAVAPLLAWKEQLGKLGQILGQLAPDEVCCEGLTPRQCVVLRTLVEQEGSRLSDLAQVAGISPSALTRLIERLEAGQLVLRVRGAQEDGRAAAVVVTEKGRALYTRLEALSLANTEAVVLAIPEDQRAVVLSSLQLLTRALLAPVCCSVPRVSSTP